MESPKSLTLNVRLSPDAKKPPKGAIKEAKVARTKTWNWIGGRVTAEGRGRERLTGRVGRV